MADNYTKIGNADIFRAAGYGCTLDEQKTVVFVYHGKYSTLEGKEAKKGVKWTDESASGSWTVLHSELTHEAGDMGTLRITCVPFQAGDAGDATTDRYEIQFVETAQPLAFHEDFPANGSSGVDKEQLKTWQLFLSSPESVRLELKYCEDPEDPATAQALPDDLEDWAELYNKGITAFRVWLPVVTRVRTYERSPEKETSGVGTVGAPEVVPQGYGGDKHWLKTGDNFSQEPGRGRWTRTETWTYAAEWPSLLYKES